MPAARWSRTERHEAASAHALLRPRVQALKQMLAAPDEQREAAARRLVQQLVLALQGMLMARHAPTPCADAFLASRADIDGGRVYGTLGETRPDILERILQRAWPLG